MILKIHMMIVSHSVKYVEAATTDLVSYSQGTPLINLQTV